MVEKIPKAGSPEDLPLIEKVLLNRLRHEFEDGVDLTKLYENTTEMRKEHNVELSFQEFKKMVLGFAPEHLVKLKIIVYPVLDEPIHIDRKELPLAK